MEERELIRRAKKGDAEAFGKLYETIYQRMYRYALYTLRNKQDAEDVVSETVMEAFATIKKLRSEDAFATWIFRILSVKCKHRMKEYYQKRNEDSIEEQEAQETEAIIDRSDRYEAADVGWSQKKEEYLDVRRAFFSLPDEDRMILALHLILGYKTREIAKLLFMNENTVRSKESRAIQKMGNKLKGLR